VADETGLPAGAGCADRLARAGAQVELACADRMAAEEVGQTLHVATLRALYAHGVTMTPDVTLTGAWREGNRLRAELTNGYTGETETRLVDRIVFEGGTVPAPGPFEALRPLSRNGGEIDPEALLAGRPQAHAPNPGSAFALYRIGDALVGRNVHAAIHDAARLMKTI